MADSITYCAKDHNEVRENNQILRDHEKLGLPETLYVSRKLPLDRYTLLISCNPK